MTSGKTLMALSTAIALGLLGAASAAQANDNEEWCGRIWRRSPGTECARSASCVRAPWRQRLWSRTRVPLSGSALSKPGGESV
jgi:hypothetical protein